MARTLHLKWPILGLNKRMGYQDQPPYSSPACMNVRPEGGAERRLRGGIRPGLRKLYTTTETGPCTMLQQVDAVDVNPYRVWVDGFDGSALGAEWAALDGESKPITTTPNFPGMAGPADVATVASALRASPVALDSSKDYQLDFQLYMGYGIEDRVWQIYFRTDDSSPDPTDEGYVLNILYDYSLSKFTCTLTSYAVAGNDVISLTSATVNLTWPQQWCRFQILVTTTGTNGDTICVKAYCYDQLVTVLAATQDASPPAAGDGFGFKVDGTIPTQATSLPVVDYVKLVYQQANYLSGLVTYIVHSEPSSGLMRQIPHTTGVQSAEGPDIKLQVAKPVSSAVHNQIIFIADYGPKILSGTDGVTAADPGLVFTSAATGSWPSDVVAGHMAVEITETGTGAALGVYPITAVSGTDITLQTTPGFSKTGIDFHIRAFPKKYNVKAAGGAGDYRLLPWAASTAGTIPQGCSVIGRYRDRIFLGGADDAPQQWYLSRSGDPLDWDYSVSAGDPSRAISGTTGNAGIVGDRITAFIPHNDDAAIIACVGQLWILRGDPAGGGSMSVLSHTVGVIDKEAWCYGPSGGVLFLGREGLYEIPPAGGDPVPISGITLPQEFVNIDTEAKSVNMIYDPLFSGYYIFLTNRDSDTGATHWWFDRSGQSFWPVRVASGMDPFCSMSYSPISQEDHSVIMGGYDGYLRTFDRSSAQDESTAINAYVQYGPFRLGGDDTIEGLVSEIECALSGGSSDVTWKLFAEDTHEMIATGSSKASGTWSSNLNNRIHPRIRGVSAVLQVGTTVAITAPWSVERIAMKMEPKGRKKRD